MDGSLARAKVEAIRFQELVRQYVKRVDPVEFALSVANRIAQVLAQRDLMGYWPPHHLLHALEVNCAFHHKGCSDPVTEERLRRTINLYHEHHDPVSKYLLSEVHRLDLFLIATARQQFFWQKRPSANDYGRALQLFGHGLYPKTAALFQQKFGFDFEQWLTFCFSLFAGLNNMDPPIIGREYFANVPAQLLPSNTLNAMFGLMSATPGEIGRSYLASREKLGVLYDLYIPSIFMKKPLIALPSGSYLAVHTDLVGHQGPDGLFDVCRDNWPGVFGSEFGKAFERYVGKVLEQLCPGRVFAEKDLRRFTEQKMCDFIVSTDSCLFFLECKAVEYRATLSTEAAIKGDNSTTKIGTAVEQLFSAANLVNEGVLTELLGDIGSKPFIAATITYRHVYFVNGDRYWTEVIVPSVKSGESEGWHTVFAFRPQTLDISELEKLLLVARGEEKTVLDLWREKLSKSEMHVGEWQTYLNGRMREEYKFPLLDTSFEEFTEAVIRRFQVE